jgi:hypothetical protein
MYTLSLLNGWTRNHSHVWRCCCDDADVITARDAQTLPQSALTVWPTTELRRRLGAALAPGRNKYSQGVQAGSKALRIRHLHGMEVRKKGPRGFK